MLTSNGPVQRSGDVAAAARSSSGIAWQFGRFVVVGGISSALYAALFLVLVGINAQLANLVAGTASMLLANQLHRLVTFRAGGRVTWLTAQIQGGGLSVVALVATSSSLAALNRLVGDTTALQQLLLVGAVSGAIGVCRFVALRALVFRSPVTQADGAESVAAAMTSRGPQSLLPI